MDELVRLRQELHRYPELSGHENSTGKRIRFFLNRYRPHELLTGLGGEGMAAIYQGAQPGPTLLFRCELDALPLREATQASYRSTSEGVSHACGHDGHMAMVSGLAIGLIQNPITHGRAILLYQPEEENGQGAQKVIAQLQALGLVPSMAIALHNMPGHPLGSVVLSRGTFCCASQGIVVTLQGRAAHAATPENGINPAGAIAEMVQQLSALPTAAAFSHSVMVTIIRIGVGDWAFGTSPGHGELLATLRAESAADMEQLTQRSTELIRAIANRHGLVLSIAYTDHFPPVINDQRLTAQLEAMANELGQPVIHLSRPNPWSEDFAHFALQGPAVLIGLGVGEKAPPLHSPEYNFPDAAIPFGLNLLNAMVNHHLREHSGQPAHTANPTL